jgi:hypothetical protein
MGVKGKPTKMSLADVVGVFLSGWIRTPIEGFSTMVSGWLTQKPGVIPHWGVKKKSYRKTSVG